MQTRPSLSHFLCVGTVLSSFFSRHPSIRSFYRETPSSPTASSNRQSKSRFRPETGPAAPLPSPLDDLLLRLPLPFLPLFPISPQKGRKEKVSFLLSPSFCEKNKPERFDERMRSQEKFA